MRINRFLSVALGLLALGIALVGFNPSPLAQFQPWQPYINSGAISPSGGQTYVSGSSGFHHWASAASPQSITLPGAIPTGASVVICLDAGGTSPSITDNAGSPNTYPIIEQNAGTFNYIAALANVSGNATVITVSYTGTHSGNILVDVFSGVTTLDVHSFIPSQAAPGTGTDAIVSGSKTTTGTDLIWGCAVDDTTSPSTIVAGTGFTVAQNQNSNASTAMYSEYRTNKAAGTFELSTFTTTGNGGDTFDAAGVAFK